MDGYVINELITKAHELLKNDGFEYAFCGGYGIELFLNGIPYLAPEFTLLYKFTNTEREGYQLDCDSAIVDMIAEQKDWLQTALKTMNTSEQKWLEVNVL